MNNALEISTFVLVGYFMGKYQDVRKLQFTMRWTGQAEKPGEYGRKVLVCSESTISAMVADAQAKLLEGGFQAGSVTAKVLKLEKESIAASILEEQQNLHYDTIVVGCSKMSKTEELLFGNVAVKLVRDSDCPVVSVC